MRDEKTWKVLKVLNAIKILQEDTKDIETTHIAADEVLCNLLTELGYQDIVDVYKEIRKWYS